MGRCPKIIVSAVALLFSITAFAVDHVSIALESVRLYDLVKIAYGEQGAGYTVDGELLADQELFSLDVQGKTKKQIRDLVDGLLREKGFISVAIGGRFDIRKFKPDSVNQSQFFYRPKHRSVTYITDMLNGVFESGRFTFQSKKVDIEGAQTSSAIPDGGTSVYSMQQKPQDAFLFIGQPHEVDLLKTLLADLDRPQDEVMVKAYLYEVSNTKSEGSAFNLALNILSGRFGIEIAGETFANTINIALDDVQAVFSAFNSDNRFKVVSNPSIRVKDGETANFTVGAEVPVLGSQTTQNSGAVTQAVEYKSSGTILDISPVMRADTIELSIRQQVSNFIRTTSGVNGTPTLIKRELSSVIQAHDGDLIMIGGLNESTDTAESVGLSWLPKFMRTNTQDNTQNDILLVLHVTRL